MGLHSGGGVLARPLELQRGCRCGRRWFLWWWMLAVPMVPVLVGTNILDIPDFGTRSDHCLRTDSKFSAGKDSSLVFLNREYIHNPESCCYKTPTLILTAPTHRTDAFHTRVAAQGS